MKFSDLAFDFVAEKNPLYELKAQKEAAKEPLTDLVRANLSEAGILFPQNLLSRIIAESLDKAAHYKPDTFGQPIARAAVSNFYAQQGELIDAENILLTPGTSISFLYCFKLLANPGDEILCPSPSYPLLDYIAMMSHVKLVPYQLLEHRQWCIDFDALEANISERTRAIVLISPHNPTGMYAGVEELNELARIARKYKLAIISDEVFSEFLFEPPAHKNTTTLSSVLEDSQNCADIQESSVLGEHKLPRLLSLNAPLVFTLNGLSKSFALPGVKVGWILMSGDRAQVKRARAALEMISDTYLPVNEIMQFALPNIFELGKPFLAELKARIRSQRQIAMTALSGCKLVRPRAGFYLTLPVSGDEEDIALDLLERKNILVHPGHYYEIEGKHLVLSYVHKEDQLAFTLAELKHYC